MDEESLHGRSLRLRKLMQELVTLPSVYHDLVMRKSVAKTTRGINAATLAITV